MTGSHGMSLVEMKDGARLQVKILGDDDKSKSLVIALHGAPGISDHREPEAAFGFLASRFRVLVYDARGSGRSDLKGPYTHDRWTADVDELRGSYGGFIALEYAIRYPSNVSGIILRDTWAAGAKGTMYSLKSSLTSPRVKVDPDRQYRAWTGTLMSNEDLEAAFSEIQPMYSPEKPGSLQVSKPLDPASLVLHYETHNFAMSYNQPRFDVRQKLNDISAPTLVIVGRDDPITPVGFSQEIHEMMQNSELAIFEKSGHSPPTDEPEAFQNRVLTFLDRFRL